MSYTELHTGILHLVPIEGEEQVKEYLKQQLIENKPDKTEEYSQLDDWDDICDELYYNDLNRKFYWDRKKWKVYEILHHKEYSDEEYIDEWERQPNGDIKFITQFYNGGCCFEEAIDYGIERV